MKIIFLIFVSCMPLSGMAVGQTQRPAELDVLKFVDKYDNAWNRKDAAAIQRILAPDFVYFTSKGSVESRQALIDEVMSPTYKVVSANRTEMRVYSESGTTAVVSSRWKGQGDIQRQRVSRRPAMQHRPGAGWTDLASAVGTLHSDCESMNSQVLHDFTKIDGTCSLYSV